MVNVPLITRRELRSYFVSPIAYIVLTVFALIHGMIFAQMFTRTPTVNLTDMLKNTFGNTLFLLILAAPMITMGLIAEETSKGTIESLLTAPVTDLEVILGKYLAALLFCVVMFAPTLIDVLMAEIAGEPDYGPILTGYVSLFLMSAQFMAIGLFCSALTRSQIAAGIITIAILMGLSIVGFVFSNPNDPTVKFLVRLSPFGHVQAFLDGVIDTRDLIYYGSTTFVFLFLSVRVLESRRWR